MTTSTPSILEGTLPATTWFHRSLRRFQGFSEWLAVLVGFCIPLATTVVEVLMALYLYTLISAWELPLRGKMVWANRVCRWVVILIGVMLAGMWWTSAPYEESIYGFVKHRELLYAPLFLTAFRRAEVRRRGVQAFMLGATVLMLLSYAEYLFSIDIGLHSSIGVSGGASAGYVIFKDRIVHNLLMSFLAFLFTKELFQAEISRIRLLYAAGLLLCLGNMLFLVQGRTGYLVTAALMVLLFYQWSGWRGLAYAAVVVPAVGFSAYFTSEVVKERVDSTLSQIGNHFGDTRRRSPDPRLEFYETTIRMIAERPWLGSGTGSFHREFREFSRQTGARYTADPHSEYLLVAAQWGLVGLLVFLTVLGRAWWYSGELATLERNVAQGMLVTVATGCLFNSLLLGFTGGLFFGYFMALCYAGLPETRAESALTEGSAAPANNVTDSPSAISARAA
jgi:O-antigen ligase